MNGDTQGGWLYFVTQIWVQVNNPLYSVKYGTTIFLSPTRAQLMRGEFPETLCIEQGVEWCFLACLPSHRKVQWTSRVLWMAVVSQSSENSSRQEKRELPCREQHTIPEIRYCSTNSQCTCHRCVHILVCCSSLERINAMLTECDKCHTFLLGVFNGIIRRGAFPHCK